MRTAVLVVAALGAIASIATAEPSSKLQRAEALLAEGRKLSEAEDYDGACEKFNEAIALAPNEVNTMFNLGVCNQHLKKYATALSWFRRTRVFSREHNLSGMEEKALARSDEITPLVPTAKIVFRGSPPSGAKVAVDGYPVPPDSYSKIELDPGHHQIDVTAPRVKRFHAEVEVDEGQSRVVQVAMGEGSSTPDDHDRDHDHDKTTDQSDPNDEPPASADDRKTLARYLALGGSGALLLSGGVALYARMKYDQCVRDGVALPTCNGQNGLTAANHYRAIARYGATPLFLGGAGLIGYAIYVYVTIPDAKPRDRDRDNKEHVSWTPVIGSDQAGVAVFGRF